MASDGGLPGVSRADTDGRVILHVDNDCFYAACERLREPALEGEPVIVGMGFEPGDDGGAVATASYEARDNGVESAQAISAAMERLPPREQVDPSHDGPTAHYRPVDMEYYQACAEDVRSILSAHAETMRRVSIDESYLDCSDRTNWDDAESFAAGIKEAIADDVGLPVSIGVATNMGVAKIASDHDKPDGLVVVPPDRVEPFLHPLPLEDLHGVGPVTAGELHDRGLETIGDVAAMDRGELAEDFGDRGAELHDRANGEDRRMVTPRGDPKSLSRESAFGDPTTDVDDLRERVQSLAQAVAERATGRGAMYRTIGIKVVTPPFDIHTRERSLSGPVDDHELVASIADDLLEEFHGDRVRKVGVRVSNLSFDEKDQASLGNWAGEDTGNEWVGHRGSQGRLTDYVDEA